MGKKIDDIWNYCDEKQKEIYLDTDISEFQQGKIIAYREIQHIIRKRCTDLKIDDMKQEGYYGKQKNRQRHDTM